MQAFCTRGLVAAALAVCLSLGAAGTAAASGDDRDRCPNRGVPTDQISVQLWTFAEYIGFGTDAATINRTRTVFDALRGMGYRNVEPFTLSGLTAEQYRAICCASTSRGPTRAMSTSGRRRRRPTSTRSSLTTGCSASATSAPAAPRGSRQKRSGSPMPAT